MQKGDFVAIDFIGRVEGTGEIFDLTLPDVAKKENVYNEKISYKPATVIVGAGLVIRGLDEAVEGMQIGEKKKIEIPAEKAFGERMQNLIKLIPLSAFAEQNINPEPGSYVTIDNVNGRVVSADGGRVRVDFNHPLAGKKLEYELEVKSQIIDKGEQVKAVVVYFTGVDHNDVELVVNGKDAEISFKKKFDLPIRTKENISRVALQWVKDLEKLKFSDVYSK